MMKAIVVFIIWIFQRFVLNKWKQGMKDQDLQWCGMWWMLEISNTLTAHSTLYSISQPLMPFFVVITLILMFAKWCVSASVFFKREVITLPFRMGSQKIECFISRESFCIVMFRHFKYKSNQMKKMHHLAFITYTFFRNCRVLMK